MLRVEVKSLRCVSVCMCEDDSLVSVSTDTVQAE